MNYESDTEGNVVGRGVVEAPQYLSLSSAFWRPCANEPARVEHAPHVLCVTMYLPPYITVYCAAYLLSWVLRPEFVLNVALNFDWRENTEKIKISL